MKTSVKSQSLYRRLRDRLLDGSIVPDSMLPHEVVLAEEYGVARGTLRRALAQLEADNLIRRIRGKGTFAGGGRATGVVTFLLPCPEWQDIRVSCSSALTVQLRGVIAEAQERGFRVETLAVSRTNRPDDIDFSLLNHLDADSRVIVSGIWFRRLFEFLARRRCRVCLDHEQSAEIEADRAWMGNWILLENDVEAAARQGMAMLFGKGCRRIVYYAYADAESRDTVRRVYREEVTKRGLEVLIVDSPEFDKEELPKFFRTHPFDGILTNADWDSEHDRFDQHPFDNVPGNPPVFAIVPPLRQSFYSEDFQGAAFSRRRLGVDAVALLADPATPGQTVRRPLEIFTRPINTKDL